MLSCPRRRDGAPAVPARWLTRLDAFLRGRERALARHPAAAWAGLLGPARRPARARAGRRAPRPPVALRPRRLSVTAIETWLADPYAIHARYILRLEALKPLEEATDAADYGALVHEGHAAISSRISAPPGRRTARARLRRAHGTGAGGGRIAPGPAGMVGPRL